GRTKRGSTRQQHGRRGGGPSSGLGVLLGNRAPDKEGGSGTEAWADLVDRVPKGRKVSVHTIAVSAELHDVDGRLLFDGGSGGATAEGCRGALTLDLGSGGVQVDGFDGDLYVDTGSGSVRVNDLAGASARL